MSVKVEGLFKLTRTMQEALSYTEKVEVPWFVAHVHHHSLLPVERYLGGGESVDEARSHAERHCYITK